MKILTITTKKLLSTFALIALIIAPFTGSVANAAVVANWNTTGTYVINMDYLGSSNPHDMILTQDGMGNVTGNGGSPAGANVYTWVITSGTVSGDTLDFLANYTATPDAVTPQTVLHVTGTIIAGGTISGTWSDNYQGGARSGTWTTTTGNAVAIVPPVVPGTGSIGGNVVGGAGAGTLAVTSVDTVKASAIADGTFANGWKYTFNVTLPTNETHLSMKFADWMLTGGASTIPVANNMRISSPQANNAGATVLLTAQNVYSTPTLDMTSDLDPMMDGIQVKVTVEVAVPVGSVNGAYTTSYGVKTI